MPHTPNAEFNHVSEDRSRRALRLVLAEALRRRLQPADTLAAASSLRDGFPNRWQALALTSNILRRPELADRAAALKESLPAAWRLALAGESLPPAALAELSIRGELLLLELTDAGLDYIVGSAAAPLPEARAQTSSLLFPLSASELPPPPARGASAQLGGARTQACLRLHNIFKTARALGLWPLPSRSRTGCRGAAETEAPQVAPVPWKSLGGQSAALICRIESLHWQSLILKGQSLPARKGADTDGRRSDPEAADKKRALQTLDFLEAFHRWYNSVPLFGARCPYPQSGLRLAAAAANIIKIYSSEAH